MAGLYLGGGVQARGSAATSPTTVTEAAFGPSSAPSSGGAAALAPTHPAGVVLWVGVACVVGLVLVYHSLPR